MVSNENPESTVQKRVLAAIVFTDVVGFSKFASKNESRAFVAVQRDLTMMQNLCRSHRGEVLNTMGDGMMMCFGSAVDAMACALEIQRTLYSQSKTIPPGDRLQHRIGVHLGDIIRDGANVFGDGVNVAARLQAACKPDAICLSQTAYEVVKDKMKFDATVVVDTNSMHKNVGIVKMWQVPPIREYAKFQATHPIAQTPVDTSVHGATGIRAVSLIFMSVLLVSGVGLAVMFIKKPKIAEPPTKKTKSQLEKRIDQVKEANGVKKPTKTGGSTSSAPVDVVDDTVATLIQRYDFEGAAAKIVERGQDKTPAGQTKIAQLGECSQLWTWLQSEVSSATAEKPIMTNLMADDGKPYPAKVYQGKLGVTVDFGSSPVDQTLRDFKPASIVGLGRTVAANPVGAKQPLANAWIATFSKLFNVSN